MAKIPIGVPFSIQEAFRAIWAILDRFKPTGFDMQGGKITNHAPGSMDTDLVLMGQVRDAVDPEVLVKGLRPKLGFDTAKAGGWFDDSSVIKELNPADQVIIGASAVSSTIPRFYIQGTAGAVASFPTLAANDWMAIENNGNTNVGLICSASGSAAIKVFGSGDAVDDGKLRYDRSTRQWEISTKGTTVRITISDFGIQFPSITLPANPPAGSGRLYVRTVAAVTHLYFLDDAGVEHLIV